MVKTCVPLLVGLNPRIVAIFRVTPKAVINITQILGQICHCPDKHLIKIIDHIHVNSSQFFQTGLNWYTILRKKTAVNRQFFP
jgi:hypothetical protein